MSGQPQNAGQLQVKQGKWSADTCTTQNDLINNQATKPLYRKKLERYNGRYLMTLLTSGAMGSMGFKDVDTKVPVADGIRVKEAQGIGNVAYRYDSLGFIEKSAVIVSQVGASGANGAFTLKMLDTYLYKNQVVRFPSGLRAMVMSQASGSSASGFSYNFQTLTGTVFSFTTDVGTYKTCYPEYTGYSEGSLKSDSRDKHPDTFMNFMTIQRKTVAMTGSAQSDVLWYEYADGAKLGWMWWKVEEARAQFAMENERQKKFGICSMKGTNGQLLATSSLGNDPDTGLPIIMGDGFEEQVSASNVFIGTGTNGEFTLDDFINAMQTMTLNSNQVKGITYVAITGTDGYANAQQQCINLAGNQNATLFQNVTQSGTVGGASVEVGYEFTKLSFGGNSMWFIQDPMFDNPYQFPEVGLDGRRLMSSTYFFMGLTTGDKPTMEIVCKEANGLNRSYVEAKYEGLTGAKAGVIQSEVDATKVAMLKEDMLCIYNPTLCAVGYKAS